MEEDTINNFPDEVFLEIFSYFGGKSLKSLMFVCKRWYEIISSHASTMKKLPVDLRKMFVNCQEGNVWHQFHTLNIEHINIFDNDLHHATPLLFRLGRSVQMLNIGYCLINAHHLRVLLENLPHLSHLTITKSRISDDDEVSQSHNELQIKLKKLKIIQINYSILKHLNHVQVSELEIIDATNYKINHQNLIEFIQNQKSLKSLIVEEMNNNVNSIFLTNDLASKVDFTLENFSGLFCTNLARHESFNENLISFMKMHKKSLKKLKLSGTSLSSNTYKFAISHLTFLHTLEINPSSIPQENSFYKDLMRNANLKSLHLQSTITRSNFNGLIHMLHLYPYICDLKILDTDEFIANDLYHIISRELKSLSSLSVLNFNRNFTYPCKINSLNSFAIKILNDTDQFLKFLAVNDTIERIDVGWIKRDFSEDIIEKIISQPRLKHVKFGGRFIANKRIYEVISKNYRNLRTLELVCNNYDEVRNLKFVFPLDRSNYIRSKCLYFEESSDREPLND